MSENVKMKLELLPSENLPANEAVITCEGVSVKNAKGGSTGELQHRRGVDKINCSRLKKVICKMADKDYKDDNIDCNELIAYWMMEGFLGQVNSVEEAYRKGHEIFMELNYEKIPNPALYEKRRRNDSVSVSMYERYHGSRYSTMGLGFVDVFDEGVTPKLGKLVPHNGVIRTPEDEVIRILEYNKRKTPEEEALGTCLLLDGNQLDRQVLGNFKRHLKHLAYFNPRTNVLQRQLPTLNLTVLILRGCRFLEKIEACIGEMSDLEILEISGPCSIKTIPDIFKKVTKLRSLNLSYLGIEALPKYSFPKLNKLRWLILRGCSGLLELPSTRDMKKLEVIDLYGATSLRKLSTTNFRNHLKIRMLDLSNTHVKRVPCLFDYNDSDSATVTHLFLRNILEIYVFDIVQKLLSLKVLDVSGAVHLKQINIEPLEELVILDLSGTDLVSLPDDSFRMLTKLTDLKLSKTKLSSLPNISHLSSLQVLDLSGCKDLKGLGEIPFGQHWPGLLSLNLSDTSIEKFTILDSSSPSSSNPHVLEHLQVLNLSNTPIKELPSLSQLKSLIQLLLAGCSEIESVPDLKSLTVLEVLDLSGTKVEHEVLDKASRGLRKLLLKDCSRIEMPLNLASFTQLQELDLRGSSVVEFPEDILKMTHLNRLCLPHVIRITGDDWSKINDNLLKKVLWDQPAKIFESVSIVINNEVDHSMLAKPSKENHLFRLVDSQDSWEAYFKQFQFSPKEAVIRFDGVELVFKGHHPLANKERYRKPQSPSVEIHGFSSFPEESEIALKKAVNVALVDNSFLSSLSDEYFQYAETMKVCWINSCSKMELLLKGELQNAGAFRCLETLVLSNLAMLKAFCEESEKSPSQSIESLKHMYIDCCPVLKSIISPSHLPENLETLHIKFCDKLEAVCDGKTSECILPKLHELNLLGLPELHHIGADLPSLHTLIISQCPKLDNLGSILQPAQSCLTRLTLDSCPQLKHVFSSSMLPENIQELEIRSCDELVAVFDSAGSSSSTSKPSLPSLHRLQLWNLPKIKSIEGKFPSLEKREIKYCSRLLQEHWPKVKTNLHNPGE